MSCDSPSLFKISCMLKNHRGDTHLRIPVGGIEQINCRIEQLIVARIPLRGLLADLQRFADARAAIGLATAPCGA